MEMKQLHFCAMIIFADQSLPILRIFLERHLLIASFAAVETPFNTSQSKRPELKLWRTKLMIVRVIHRLFIFRTLSFQWRIL